MRRHELVNLAVAVLLAGISVIIYVGTIVFFALSSPVLFAKVAALSILANILLGISRYLLKELEGK